MLPKMVALFALRFGMFGGSRTLETSSWLRRYSIICWLGACHLALAAILLLNCNYVVASEAVTQEVVAEEIVTGDGIANNPIARELFETAFFNRYIDGPDFPGYEAEVSVTYNRQIYQGRVRVHPDYRVDIFNMAREDARNYALEQLNQAHAQHRPISFDAVHGSSDFRLVSTDASGISEIEEHGPDIDASYRIQQGRIVDVTRHIGDFDVEVTTSASIQPAAGYLPTEYREVVRDHTTNEVISAREFRDYYMKVSQYFLLHRRLMREADSLEQLSGKPVDETAIIITGIDAIPSAR